MDNNEILNRFDVLYNNIMSDKAPGLDAYEKSVFWNKATLEVLKNHINPKGNKYTEGFDGSSKRQVEFSTLLNTVSYVFSHNDKQGLFNSKAFRYQGTETVKTREVERYYIDSNNQVDKHTVSEQYVEIEDAVWPDDILSIINESVDVVTAEDWHRFAFYLSQFVTYAFVTEDYNFITNVTGFIDWMLSFGFDAEDPLLLYLNNKLQEAL